MVRVVPFVQAPIIACRPTKLAKKYFAIESKYLTVNQLIVIFVRNAGLNVDSRDVLLLFILSF